MLAEACATGRPVTIYPVPRRLESLPGSKLLREGIWRWRASRTSYRGTPKQQDRLARFYDDLVVAGLITPSRDLGAYHERLRAEGLATIGLERSEKAPTPKNDATKSIPVSDLSFAHDGWMLIAQRTMYGDMQTSAHQSTTYEVQQIGGVWQVVGTTYVVGELPNSAAFV